MNPPTLQTGTVCPVWTSHAAPGGPWGRTAGGLCLGCWWVPLGPAEASSPSVFSQRLAYGITPENEHHLVAQRDVRQFQVGSGWTVRGVGGSGVGAGEGVG